MNASLTTFNLPDHGGYFAQYGGRFYTCPTYRAVELIDHSLPLKGEEIRPTVYHKAFTTWEAHHKTHNTTADFMQMDWDFPYTDFSEREPVGRIAGESGNLDI